MRRRKDLDPAQVLRELYKALDRASVPNPVATARKLARATGVKFTDREASIWLAGFVSRKPLGGIRGERGRLAGRTHSAERTDSRTDTRTESRTDFDEGNAPISAPTPAPSAALTRGKGTPSLNLFPSSDTSYPQTAAADKPPAAPAEKTSKEKRPTKAKREIDISWVPVLQEAVEGLGDRYLRELKPSEKLLVAQSHALRFARCRSNERTNKSKSRGIARNLDHLIDELEKRRFLVTVAEYFENAERFFEKTGPDAWHTPIDLRIVWSTPDDVAARGAAA